MKKQTDLCRSYIAENFPEYADIVSKIPVFEDKGCSAFDLKRPGLRKLIESIVAGKTATFVTPDLSRLHRKPTDTIKFDQFLKTSGASAVAVQENVRLGEGGTMAVMEKVI